MDVPPKRPFCGARAGNKGSLAGRNGIRSYCIGKGKIIGARCLACRNACQAFGASEAKRP